MFLKELLLYKIILVMLSFFLFLKTYKSFLMVLISFEFISMIIVFIISEMIFNWFLIFYLIYVVCDGILGLSLLILMIREFGDEYVSNLMILKW